jgi:hypothetical protein
MNNFQKRLIEQLIIGDFVKTLSLRKKYTKSFDRAFEECFGKSFGLEIEIPSTMFRNSLLDQKNNTKYLRRKITERFNHPYKPSIHIDCSCREITTPTKASTLHLTNKLLNVVKKDCQYTIGVEGDTASSMHIHINITYNRKRHMNNDFYGSNFLKNLHTTTEIKAFKDFILVLEQDEELFHKIRDSLRNDKDTKQYNHFLNLFIHTVIMGHSVTGNRFNSTYDSLEIKWLHGSFDIQLVLLRTMFFRGLQKGLELNDASLFLFCLDLINKKY